uniref:Uncharacterized protein n=1 Tax=Plectus sambesii TaxID=2011161 RepID=A0A914W5C5_9BILA
MAMQSYGSSALPYPQASQPADELEEALKPCVKSVKEMTEKCLNESKMVIEKFEQQESLMQELAAAGLATQGQQDDRLKEMRARQEELKIKKKRTEDEIQERMNWISELEDQEKKAMDDLMEAIKKEMPSSEEMFGCFFLDILHVSKGVLFQV